MSVSFALSVIHPDLFRAGMEILDHCCRKESHSGRTYEWARMWNSVYTALTVISGRISVPHVDSHGRPNYLDALISLGDAAKPKIIFKELNVEFPYKAGTALFFSGRGWTHEVPLWGKGERICYAYYMRPEIVQAHGRRVDTWGLNVSR
ncbi:hypothetical protein K435DRAFT_695981 [Dendrothele bispora CBS 962.96]|uniref:Prolyl 4-hydroxylase alpha subunit Fe(2+) 2OG dioxygenase domain-containing protein n=1 Tax=Dendrothele bispora (strain CBS 962.96) TaxID=1314807 RepID=A0A4S8KWU2_DENBC|nr:hypothetical protein K435DRAFT_695981 [Dendrothele bispora CBS 962.96]